LLWLFLRRVLLLPRLAQTRVLLLNISCTAGRTDTYHHIKSSFSFFELGSGHPWTQDTSASPSQVLGLQLCITTPGCISGFLFYLFIFIYSYVHTLLGPFLPTALHPLVAFNISIMSVCAVNEFCLEALAAV
jgi:hypothetical protein